jgi:hypothetical protein
VWLLGEDVGGVDAAVGPMRAPNELRRRREPSLTGECVERLARRASAAKNIASNTSSVTTNVDARVRSLKFSRLDTRSAVFFEHGRLNPCFPGSVCRSDARFAFVVSVVCRCSRTLGTR